MWPRRLQTTLAPWRTQGRPAGRDRSGPLRLRVEARRTAAAAPERAVVLDGDGEGTSAGGRDLVVAARRPLLGLSNRRGLPAGSDEAGALEAAENRVDGATRKGGPVHDVEAVPDTAGDCLEHGHGGGR